jgi:hypothetical protein
MRLMFVEEESMQKIRAIVIERTELIRFQKNEYSEVNVHQLNFFRNPNA